MAVTTASTSEPATAILQEELRTLNEQYAETERQNLALRRQLHTARSNERRLQDQISAMRKSFSWRVTLPYRALRRLFSIGRS